MINAKDKLKYRKGHRHDSLYGTDLAWSSTSKRYHDPGGGLITNRQRFLTLSSLVEGLK